jgi:hypothetical protein
MGRETRCVQSVYSVCVTSASARHPMVEAKYTITIIGNKIKNDHENNINNNNNNDNNISDDIFVSCIKQ